MDYTFALTPALSPRRRGRRSRRFWKPTRPGVGAPSGRKGSSPTDATEAIELSNSARKFSLSLGERAGVPRKLSGLTFGDANYPGPTYKRARGVAPVAARH